MEALGVGVFQIVSPCSCRIFNANDRIIKLMPLVGIAPQDGSSGLHRFAGLDRMALARHYFFIETEDALARAFRPPGR